MKKSFFVLAAVAVIAAATYSQQNQQPLNSQVSGFGTSFIFSPAPICSGCIETEIGFYSLRDGRFVPAILTVAPFQKARTDFTVIFNAVESERVGGEWQTSFGSRYDFIIRQQVVKEGDFILTIAPRGTVFSNGGGRAGATIALQYGHGKNLGVANLTYMGGVAGPSQANPKHDFVGAFDFSRLVSQKGYSIFTGVQYERATQSGTTIGAEGGLVVPFKNGQIEFAIKRLNLTAAQPVWMVQGQVVFNLGKVLR